MADACPTCGRLMERTAESVLAVLVQHPGREIYAGARGGYYITYGGGEVPASVVRELLAAGRIRAKWPDEPKIESWVLDPADGR